MKKLFYLILLCVGCAAAPPPPKTPVAEPCPTLPVAPPCEDKVIVMDEKGATCPSNTKATFPFTGYLVPGKTVVLCQCK